MDLFLLAVQPWASYSSSGHAAASLPVSESLPLSLPSSGETAQVQRPGPEKERPWGGGAVMSMQWSPFLPSGKLPLEAGMQRQASVLPSSLSCCALKAGSHTDVYF